MSTEFVLFFSVIVLNKKVSFLTLKWYIFVENDNCRHLKLIFIGLTAKVRTTYKTFSRYNSYEKLSRESSYTNYSRWH